MAPARIEEDPVTAEYDVYLTPAIQEQIYLLQYPNRDRQRPYNARGGVRPDEMRIKPKAGYLELDVNLNTEHNFNKYRALKWGDSMQTSRQVHNDSATYGPASGFTAPRPRGNRRMALKDDADRELELQNDLATFYDAERNNKVLQKQTLGGQIMKHDSAEEAGKPLYFVGAFRGSELHLTKVTGTVQMRPQFHHVDAEDQRSRLAASREYGGAGAGPGAADGMEAGEVRRAIPDQPRIIQQTYRASTNPKGELEQREHEMKLAHQAAAEEQWSTLEFVDEDDDEAYETWNDRMFVKDTEGAMRLKSKMSDEEYLDEISTPRRESPNRRRKRAARRKEMGDLDEEENDGDG